MRTSLKLLSLATAVTLAGFGTAAAQSSGTTTGGGVTSGPAAGQPATLGTGGVVPATKPQTGVLQHKGGKAIKAEKRGQHGGTRAGVKPGKSDAGAGVHQGQKTQK